MTKKVYREQQLASRIQSLVATWIERYAEFPDGTLVTVTRAEVSPGRKHARVWISALPESSADEVFKAMKRNRGKVQSFVSKHIPTLPVPRITIDQDVQPEADARIEQLIQALRKEES